MREDNDPITEALGRVVTTLDVIGLEAFVPEPPRGPGRPPEDRRALARAFVAKAVLSIPTTSALIERLDVDKSLRRILGWERRSQVPSEATFSRAFAEFARGEFLPSYSGKSRVAAAFFVCLFRSLSSFGSLAGTEKTISCLPQDWAEGVAVSCVWTVIAKKASGFPGVPKIVSFCGAPLPRY